jgi:hypothetical protein
MPGDETARSLPAVAAGAPGADVARAAVVGTIGMIPIVGSLLSELLSTFYPETKLKRLLGYAEELQASSPPALKISWADRRGPPDPALQLSASAAGDRPQ